MIDYLERVKSHKPEMNSIISFDSDFECGNLEFVFEKELFTYDIFLRSDSNG